LIELNLRIEAPRNPREAIEPPRPSLEQIERTFRGAVDDLAVLLDQTRRAVCHIPTELIMQATSLLIPPERMGVIGGRSVGGYFVLGTLFDVTGVAHRAHVRADPHKLAAALLALERSGAHVAAWVHSHPGHGPRATAPSEIDRVQYAEWTRDFSAQLVGIIVVADGYVRLWGDAVECRKVRAEWLGDGVSAVQGHAHVYRLRS
jgi:proteasome lid subunit RPN8/RPN11